VTVRLALLVVLTVTACKKSPSCEAVGDHVLSLQTAGDELAPEIRAVFVKQCTDDDWPAEARRCLLETASMAEPKNCRERLTSEQNMKLTKALTNAELAVRGRVLPKVCEEFEALVTAVGRCEQAPKELRDSLRGNLEIAKASWAQMTDKSVAASSCRSAIHSIKQVVPAACGN
jgi:hypothetical protein